MDKNIKKTPYDVKITSSLLQKPDSSLSDLEKEAIRIYKNRITSYSNDLDKCNETIREDCKILCGGRFCERDLIPAYGWIDPVKKMAYKLEKLNYFYRKWGMHVQFDQTKEKFGTFRGYWSIQHTPTCFFSKYVNRLNDFLTYDVDYAKQTIVDEECHETLEWEECTKEEYSKKLSRFGDKVKKAKIVKRHDDVQAKPIDKMTVYFMYDKKLKKYMRSYWLMHGAKTHVEITKHKWLFKISSIVHKLDSWLSSKHREDIIENVMHENFYNEVDNIVNECEKECHDLCQKCGAFIGDGGHADRCETTGWITYICDRCAIADGRIYYNHKSKKWMREDKKAENPYAKTRQLS